MHAHLKEQKRKKYCCSKLQEQKETTPLKSIQMKECMCEHGDREHKGKGKRSVGLSVTFITAKLQGFLSFSSYRRVTMQSACLGLLRYTTFFWGGSCVLRTNYLIFQLCTTLVAVNCSHPPGIVLQLQACWR